MQHERYYYENHPKQKPIFYPPHTYNARAGAISAHKLHLVPVKLANEVEEDNKSVTNTPTQQYCTISTAGQLYLNSEFSSREGLHRYESAEITYDAQHKILAVKFIMAPTTRGLVPVVPRKGSTMIYLKPFLNSINLAPQFILGRRAILFYDRTPNTKTFVILFGQPK